MAYSEEGFSIVQRPCFVLTSKNMEAFFLPSSRPRLFLNGAGHGTQGFSHTRKTLDYRANPQPTETLLTDSWVNIDRCLPLASMAFNLQSNQVSFKETGSINLLLAAEFRNRRFQDMATILLPLDSSSYHPQATTLPQDSVLGVLVA